MLTYAEVLPVHQEQQACENRGDAGVLTYAHVC
jgi:hypothetical protein